MDLGSGIGGIISNKNLHPGGASFFFHYDGWGNVIELSDEAGQSQAGYSYDAYGNQIKRTGGEDNAYRFSTKEYSSLTGLIYFGARYYDPEIGRFLTKDPLGFAGGINQYIYCESDPVNWIDPWGLCKGGNSRWKWSPGNWREDFKDWLIENFGIPEAHADEIVKSGQIRTFTWPYSWKGWGGVVLVGAGGLVLVIPAPGARPVGFWMIGIGVGLTAWDTAEGIKQALELGEEIGEMWLERDREEWEEIGRYLK